MKRRDLSLRKGGERAHHSKDTPMIDVYRVPLVAGARETD